MSKRSEMMNLCNISTIKVAKSLFSSDLITSKKITNAIQCFSSCRIPEVRDGVHIDLVICC